MSLEFVILYIVNSMFGSFGDRIAKGNKRIAMLIKLVEIWDKHCDLDDRIMSKKMLHQTELV